PPRHVCNAPVRPQPPPLVVVLLRPPPSSTLFPYTTLFRSNSARPAAEPEGDGEGVKVAEEGPSSRIGEEPCSVANASRPYVLWADRKSTRLNSSHVKISYAVFCLKKKKTDMPARRR